MSIIKNIFFKSEPYNIAEFASDLDVNEVIYGESEIAVSGRAIKENERKVLADGLLQLIGESGASPEQGEKVMEYINRACLQIAVNEQEELEDLRKQLNTESQDQ